MKKIWNVRSSAELDQPMTNRTPDRTFVTSQPKKLIQTVSVILPVYNEQACVGRTFEAILQFLSAHPHYTFIFVDDGSSDRTKEILHRGIKMTEARQVKVLSYQPRAGKGFAILRGIEHAESDAICYLDGDLAYSLEHLDLLVKELATCDVAIGSRSLATGNHKDVKFSRKLAGKIFNLLSRFILRLPYSDMQAGLKGFRKAAAKDLFGKQSLTGFSFDVELIYLAKKRGYSIGEIPAKVSSSHQTKISKVNLLQDSIRMLIDLLKIRWNDQLGRYR
jgi:dolichyl-phosphate beta-glucosyltransferase